MARGIALAIVALFAALLIWHPTRVALQTLLLLPGLFPSAPIDPLSLVTAAPQQQSITLTYAAGTIDVQLFQPASGGQHAAVILLLGAGDLPRMDLAVHFADELARAGVVVMLPESDGLLAERLTFAEVDGIRSESAWLDQRPEVDASRVGIIGLSAAGGLAIVAAAQPDLRNQITLVNSFGSYEDARTLVLDVASRSIDVDGQLIDWQPEPRTQEVIAIALIDSLSSEADRMLLQRAFLAHEDVDWTELSDAALPMRDLLQGTTRERAQADIAALPAQTRQQLQQISPSSVLGEVRARLYVMHDLDDSFIPFTESRALVTQAPPGLVQRYTEFSIFAHVIPDRDVPWQTFVPDLWRLFWHVHAVLLELL